MSLSHDDLVALALGGLAPDEAERARAELENDPAAQAELASIEKHMDLHEQTTTIAPAPRVFAELRERLEEPATPSRSLLGRFWMPFAAAALVMAAFFVPRPDAKVTVAEVEELVEPGELDANFVHTPGIYVNRIIQGKDYEKPIEFRTTRDA